MIGYRFFRYVALGVLIGFVAVCGITLGGTAINIGQGRDSNKPEARAQSDDWNTGWQWVPTALVSTASDAYHRSAQYEFFIAYHGVSNLSHIIEGHRPDLMAGYDHRPVGNHRVSQNSHDLKRAANRLHIQF